MLVSLGAVSDNSIGVDSIGRRSSTGMNSIVMGLASNVCNIRVLNLSENFLGNEECIMLSSVLPSMFDLRDLDISFNDVHR